MNTLFILLVSFLNFNEDFKLQNGDLIFQESYLGTTTKAIKGVTSSAHNYQFTHVGIVYIDNNDSIFIIEATHPNVKMTPLSEYLYPSTDTESYPTSVVARLQEKYQKLIPNALSEALKLIGKEYDFAYDMNNDKYYCSELIYIIFEKANNGIPIFQLNPMTFKSDPQGEILLEWIEHFNKIGLPVPEGEPGCNPGGMSKSNIIDIVHLY